MMMRLIAPALLFAAGSAALAAAPQKDVGEKSADAADKVICKRFPVTGSLVQSNRICKTKVEWERERDNLRQAPGSTACQATGQGGPCG